MYLAHFLLTLGPRWAKQLQSREKDYTISFCDQVKELRDLAVEKLLCHLRMQRKQLLDTIRSSGMNFYYTYVIKAYLHTTHSGPIQIDYLYICLSLIYRSQLHCDQRCIEWKCWANHSTVLKAVATAQDHMGWHFPTQCL